MGGTSSRDEHRWLGALLLGLVADWNVWVARRVETFGFAGDDERVLHRRQSVDFTLPPVARDASLQLVRGLGGFPVPLTFVKKWQLPQFSLRDEADVAVPLLRREHTTRLAGEMLIALGTFTMSGGRALVPAEGSAEQMPATLRADLATIAAEDPSPGLRRCDEFGWTNGTSDPADARWRKSLAESEVFMSLAYELALSFPLMALIPPGRRGNGELVAFSYNSYVVPAVGDRWRVLGDHGLRRLRNRSRDLIEPEKWEGSGKRRTPGARTEGSGTIVISTTCTKASRKVRLGATGVAAAILTIVGEDRRRAVRLRPAGTVSISGMPPGRYRLSIEDRSEFRCELAEAEVEVGPEEIRRVHVETVRQGFTAVKTLAPRAIATPAKLSKRSSRGLGWSSKPLAIRVRFGGGEYHCGFEAPPGMHTTRGRLISNLDGNVRLRDGELAAGDDRRRYVDSVLESGQRVDLDDAPGGSRPATAYAFVNLRPRRETIIRPALLTAFVTLFVILLLACNWDGDEFGRDGDGGLLSRVVAIFFSEGGSSGELPWGLLAVLLGGPTALAAYFAQAIPSRVTNAMLFGLRLTALVPAALSLLAAGALLDTAPFGTQTALEIVAVLALAACSVLFAAHYYAEHPLEQNPTKYRQGPIFTTAHLDGDDYLEVRAEVPFVLSRETIAPGEQPLAGAIRDRMLERASGMTAATRRTLLGQRWFRFWEREVPPALYFDSVEAPVVFLGLCSKDRQKDLEGLIEESLKGLRAGCGSNPPVAGGRAEASKEGPR